MDLKPLSATCRSFLSFTSHARSISSLVHGVADFDVARDTEDSPVQMRGAARSVSTLAATTI